MKTSAPLSVKNSVAFHLQACSGCVERGVPIDSACAHAILLGKDFPEHPEWADLRIMVRGAATRHLTLTGADLPPHPPEGLRPLISFDEYHETDEGPFGILTTTIDVYDALVTWPPSHVTGFRCLRAPAVTAMSRLCAGYFGMMS